MSEYDNHKYLQYLQSEQWHAIAQQRLAIDNFTCVCCGSRGTAINPLEVHHLSYKWLYHEQNRVYEDLVTLCHCCHKSLHNTMNRITSPTGRRGWSDNQTIPKIHAFNVSGNNVEFMEVQGQ